jgi:methylglyoxal synthase
VLQACRKIVVVRQCTAYRSPLQIEKQTENKLIKKNQKNKQKTQITKLTQHQTN